MNVFFGKNVSSDSLPIFQSGCFIFLLLSYLSIFCILNTSTLSEKAMASHSSSLAWKIPWTEEPGMLQSIGLQRVGHDWAISLSCIGEGNGNPLQYSCLENPRDGGAWWAAVYGVAQSWTRLQRRSSSSSSSTLSDIWFANIFFHSGGCLFTLMMVSLAMQKIFSLM